MNLFYDPKVDTVFEALFGRSIIAWNSAETDVRNLLHYLASDRGNVTGLGPWILVAEMGTRHLSQTLQTYADATLDGDEKALVHLVSVIFDNLVAYRNHYVHGMYHLIDNIGRIGATSAKSKYKIIHGDVPIEELGAFIDKVGDLVDLALGTLEFLQGDPDNREVPKMPEPLPNLEKQTTHLPLRAVGSDEPPADLASK